MTRYDQKHLCRAPSKFPPCVLAKSGVSTTRPRLWPAAPVTMPVKYKHFALYSWELHAPVGKTERRAAASWPGSLCRKKRRAQRGCDMAISPRPLEGSGAFANVKASE